MDHLWGATGAICGPCASEIDGSIERFIRRIANET